MAQPRRERTQDDDLRFWSAVARRIVEPKGVMAEVRANTVFALITFFALYLVWCVHDRFRGVLPSRVVATEVLNNPVQAGDDLKVRIALVRNKVCEREFEWIVADHTGHRERFAEAPMHGIGNPGPDTFVQHFRVPGDMEPGRATLRVIWSWQCPENLYETIYPVVLILPEIDFEIAKPAT